MRIQIDIDTAEVSAFFQHKHAQGVTQRKFRTDLVQGLLVQFADFLKEEPPATAPKEDA